MRCTRCDGTGFLNLEQVDEATLKAFEESGDHQVILDWLDDREQKKRDYGGCSCCVSPPCFYCTEIAHDVSICDCCGDGEDWHNQPGEHDRYDPNDPCGCR